MVLHLQARVCMCLLQEQGIDEKPLLKTHIAGIYRNTSCSCRALTYYHWTCFFCVNFTPTNMWIYDGICQNTS
uniref:Uncharacterized protein n=1 Tax=Setaria italica TaxID=4555 RepID=K3YKL8_SETIT